MKHGNFPSLPITDFPDELFENIFSKVSEGIMITDLDKRIVHVNPAFELVTGFSREEVLGKTPKVLQSGIHNKAFYDEMWKQIHTTGEWQGDIWNKRKNGEIYPEWLAISAIRDAAGDVAHYCGIFTDMSHLHLAEKKLKKMALTDPLTGISNRHDFSERIAHILQTSEKYDIHHAVLFLDLDRFKQINDSFGHRYGDQLLVELSGRIRKLLKNKDLFARYGGDEFIIAQTSIKHIREAARLAEQIIETLEKPFVIFGETLYVSSSIGIALYPNDGESSDELVRKADKAMYSAKQNGRNQFVFYHDDLKMPSKRIMVLESELRRAIEEKSFTLVYQPQVDIRSRKIVGLEALVRWRSDVLGDVSPAEFIPFAEESGLIIPLSEAIFDLACDHFVEKGMAKNLFVPISLNVSALHFQQKDFVSSIKKIFENRNCSPKFFDLEMTEHMIMASGPAVEERLKELKELGFQLSIDDFGTGYSSLAYLSRFPLDFLKIDRSFISKIDINEEDAHIVAAIINLSHSLNLAVVAEGVETEAQCARLTELGCDIFQGYLFSKPLGPDEVAPFLELWELHKGKGDFYDEI